MSVDTATPTQVVATPVTSSKSTTASTATPGIADNFQTFLTLLTTQLQNQNPLDPLDTNQFTQQLVQFAGVEQQLRSNDQLKSLIEIEKSAQATAALAYVGNTVAVDGSTAKFNGQAIWNLKTDNATTAKITITAANGQTAFSGNFSMNAGSTGFVWDGKGNDGSTWPAGAYKLTATAKDSSGNDVAIATEVQGVVDSVDLTATPALLSINGQNYTTSQIKRVMRAGGSG
jgi:flagellar basal-body rod modification protein FlgD